MRDEARACGVDPYNADCRAAVEAHGALDIMRAAATGSIVYWLSGAMLIHERLEHSECTVSCTVCSRAIGTAAPVASASSQASQELHRKWQVRPTEQPRVRQSRWGICN